LIMTPKHFTSLILLSFISRTTYLKLLPHQDKHFTLPLSCLEVVRQDDGMPLAC